MAAASSTPISVSMIILTAGPEEEPAPASGAAPKRPRARIAIRRSKNNGLKTRFFMANLLSYVVNQLKTPSEARPEESVWIWFGFASFLEQGAFGILPVIRVI